MSIGFVEVMNDDRRFLSRGTMADPTRYYYGSGDPEIDCVYTLLHQTPQ